MTKFNPENKEVLTYGECLNPAMEITEQSDADQYLADYVKYIETFILKEPDPEGRTGLQIAKINIGYYAGYYSTDVASRVYRLFDCSHPILG